MEKDRYVELALDRSRLAAKGQTMTEKVEEVIAHYRRSHPAIRAKANGKEGRLILSRLKEGSTVDDLKTACDGYHASPFHQGDNDRGQKYLSMSLIFRDAEHVARGIELWESRSEATGRTTRAGEDIKRAMAVPLDALTVRPGTEFVTEHQIRGDALAAAIKP